MVEHSAGRAGIPRSWVIACVFIVSMCIFSGLSHGWLDGRWTGSPELAKTGLKLNSLPEQIGDWSLLGEQQLDKNAQEMLRCHGSIVRIYKNVKNDQSVTLAVLFGPRGPIAVHTPDVCYVGGGAKPLGKRKKVELEDGIQTHQLWNIRFRNEKEMQPPMDTYYAWSDGRNWVASEEPRFWPTFQLYKLQVVGSLDSTGTASGCEDFLRALLPHLTPLLEDLRVLKGA